MQDKPVETVMPEIPWDKTPMAYVVVEPVEPDPFDESNHDTGHHGPVTTKRGKAADSTRRSSNVHD